MTAFVCRLPETKLTLCKSVSFHYQRYFKILLLYLEQGFDGSNAKLIANPIRNARIFDLHFLLYVMCQFLICSFINIFYYNEITSF